MLIILTVYIVLSGASILFSLAARTRMAQGRVLRWYETGLYTALFAGGCTAAAARFVGFNLPIVLIGLLGFVILWPSISGTVHLVHRLAGDQFVAKR